VHQSNPHLRQLKLRQRPPLQKHQQGRPLQALNPAQAVNREPSPVPLRSLRPKALCLLQGPPPRQKHPLSPLLRLPSPNRHNRLPMWHPSLHRRLLTPQSQSVVGNAQQPLRPVRTLVNRAAQHLRKSVPERRRRRHRVMKAISLRLLEQHGAESAAGLGQRMERLRTMVKRAQGNPGGSL
jgi:hypothetical protein